MVPISLELLSLHPVPSPALPYLCVVFFILKKYVSGSKRVGINPMPQGRSTD